MDEQAALSCCVTYLLLPLKLLNFFEMRISENCESFQWRESFCDAAGQSEACPRVVRRARFALPALARLHIVLPHIPLHVEMPPDRLRQAHEIRIGQHI